MFCTKCGFKLGAADKYCAKCGSKADQDLRLANPAAALERNGGNRSSGETGRKEETVKRPEHEPALPAAASSGSAASAKATAVFKMSLLTLEQQLLNLLMQIYLLDCRGNHQEMQDKRPCLME